MREENHGWLTVDTTAGFYAETTLLDRLLHNSAMSKNLINEKLYISIFRANRYRSHSTEQC